MMTSSNGNIFRVTGPLCGEFIGSGELPAKRPVTRSFDVFFDLRLNKRVSKQSWGWWFETPSWSLWRQCNVLKWCHTPGVSEWDHVIHSGWSFHRYASRRSIFHSYFSSWQENNLASPLHLPLEVTLLSQRLLPKLTARSSQHLLRSALKFTNHTMTGDLQN